MVKSLVDFGLKLSLYEVVLKNAVKISLYTSIYPVVHKLIPAQLNQVIYFKCAEFIKQWRCLYLQLENVIIYIARFCKQKILLINFCFANSHTRHPQLRIGTSQSIMILTTFDYIDTQLGQYFVALCSLLVNSDM